MLDTKEIKYLREVVKHTKLNIISKNLQVDNEKNMYIPLTSSNKIAALTKLDEKLFNMYDETEKKQIITNNIKSQV